MAVKIPTKPVTSWSYSRYSLYKQCPLKFKLSVLDKIPEPKGEAMARGAAIHEQAEQYLKGSIRILPGTLKSFEDDFKRLKNKRKKDPSSVIVEDTWAFTKTWGPTTWNDWNGCWLRVKLDVAERDGPRITISDYKTGRYRADNRSDYMEQLELYGTGALTVFQHVPDVVVKARLVYLDSGVIYPDPGSEVEFKSSDLNPLQKTWEKRVRPIFNDKKFAPRPNQFCRWCHYRKDNGGSCKY